MSQAKGPFDPGLYRYRVTSENLRKLENTDLARAGRLRRSSFTENFKSSVFHEGGG